MKQLTLADWAPKQYTVPMWPEHDKCYKTCKNYVSFDCYVGARTPRCSYGTIQDGTTGNDMTCMIYDNVWRMWCRYYEE